MRLARLLRNGTATLVVAAIVLGSVGSVAHARTTIRATLSPSGFQYRLVVAVSSTRPFTARTRPRSVLVRHRRTRYRLRRTARVSRAARTAATSFWRTSARNTLRRLAGKRVRITIRTRAGRRTVRRVVRVQRPTFPIPPSNLSGDAAFQRIKRYFLNSRFTDCPEGWPGCTTEHQYNHCAGGDREGRWQFRAFPPALEPARTGPYRVEDAFYSTSGSWGITYRVMLDSGGQAVYTWLVRPDGSVQGGYSTGTEVGQLSGYRWQQPAGC